MSTPRKTELGHEELRHRTRRLGQRHRTMLLLVDGQRSLEALLDMADLAGACPSHFDELVELGLVALPDQARTSHDGPHTPAAISPLPIENLVRSDPAQSPGAGTARPRGAEEVFRTQPRTAGLSALTPPCGPRPGDMEGASKSSSVQSARQPTLDESAAAESREALLRDVRGLLTQALGLEALLTTPQTLGRVRNARTPGDLISAVWEIEHHRGHAHRSHLQLLSLHRARELLGLGNTQVREEPPTTQWPDTQSPDGAASD